MAVLSMSFNRLHRGDSTQPRASRGRPRVSSRRWNEAAETSLEHQHKHVRELLKLPAGFVLHSLRHTYRARLGESGTADTFTIMRLMGHASITTSQRYVHPTPETLELAVRRMEAKGADLRGVPQKSPIVGGPEDASIEVNCLDSSDGRVAQLAEQLTLNQ